MANSIFFKALSKSIFSSNMIKGGGQGGLKRKNYWPQVSAVQVRGHNIMVSIRNKKNYH